MAVPPAASMRLDALGAALGAAADDGHAGAKRGQRLGHGAAQGAGAADHRRDFAVETEDVGKHSPIRGVELRDARGRD